MTKAQKAAVTKLKKALDACHEAGLKGGVFDSSFCVWPVDANPDPYAMGAKFFECIHEIGDTIYSPMSLDGGAGV